MSTSTRDSGEIENLIQLFVFVAHLPVDAVEMLGAAFYLVVDVQCVEGFRQFLDDFIDIFLALLFSLIDLSGQFFVKIRMELLQSDVLQFEFDSEHSQTICERRVNFESFF